MGRSIITLAGDVEQLVVSAALEHAGSEAIGVDAGIQAGTGAINVPIRHELDPEAFDVLVEFTTPAATMDHLARCRRAGRAMLIGTTGLDSDQRRQIVEAGEDIPVILAANTSVGVNLCVALLEMASRVIGDVTDIEIVEAHHRHKVDAPSGTALLMGQAIASALGRNLDEDGVFSREGHTGARTAREIGFSTIRGGDIAGEHTVMFIGDSERLEITHRATDRKIFARGALRATVWLSGQPPGLYTMADVLGL